MNGGGDEGRGGWKGFGTRGGGLMDFNQRQARSWTHNVDYISISDWFVFAAKNVMKNYK